MAIMDKVRSLHDAIATDVHDNMSIAMGCALESLIPFAASYEIIRQKRQNLTLIGPISDMQFDQLIGAGCVKKIIASWVGNVAAGLGTIIGAPRNLEFPAPSKSRSIPTLQSAWHYRLGPLACPFSLPGQSKGVISEAESSSLLFFVHLPTRLVGRSRDSARRGYPSCATGGQEGQRPRVGEFRSYARGCLCCEEGHSHLRRDRRP